jgi:hypothetical protein
MCVPTVSANGFSFYTENGEVFIYEKRGECKKANWRGAQCCADWTRHKRRIWCRSGCKGIISGMFTVSSDSSALFKRRHFDSAIIILCVRWYITYKLSSRDLREMMAERGVELAHTTILRWLQHYVPEFAKKWNRFARPVGRSWRADETYIRVRGEWKYLYRAVDKQGNTVDFLLSEHRDIAAAKRFFTRAIERQGAPEKITVDGYAATHLRPLVLMPTIRWMALFWMCDDSRTFTTSASR